MDLEFLKLHMLCGRLMRRVVLRAFTLVLAIIVVSLMQMAREVRVIGPMMSNVGKCPFNITGFLSSASSFALPLLGASPLEESDNLATIVFKELMEKHLLESDAKALCVGEKSASAVLALRHLGFFNAFGVESHPFFSLFKRRFVYELDYEDNHFDFVLSQDLDKVSIPFLLIKEIERVLRPGGIGAVLVGPHEFYSGGLVRTVVPVASFLKSSDVVRVRGIGSLKLVVFQKRLESFASFEHFKLPDTCPSVANNKPFMKDIEPLSDEVSAHSIPKLYLPNFLNISSRNKLIYINVGAGEYAKSSIAKISKTYCGTHHSAFEVFIIDHKTWVLSSYVTDPGINFIYYPVLGGDTAEADLDVSSDEFLNAPADEEGFDFARWFKESVSDGDYVVLMMNAELVELNILVELFKTGAICRVDELFLRCGDCMNLLTSLRKSGVYAHKWLGD